VINYELAKQQGPKLKATLTKAKKIVNAELPSADTEEERHALRRVPRLTEPSR
jgi:hypothetical protein